MTSRTSGPTTAGPYLDKSRGPQSNGRRFYPPTESDIFHNAVAARLYADVHRERIRAHAKHDAKDGSMERKAWGNPIWLPVLTEELGEVARVLCENELGNMGEETKARLREELVQVAAMACAWIDAIDLHLECVCSEIEQGPNYEERLLPDGGCPLHGDGAGAV